MKDDRQLIDDYLDGALTDPEEQEQFAHWLDADTDHIRQFVRETHLHRRIRELMLAHDYRAYGLAEAEERHRNQFTSRLRLPQLRRLFGFDSPPWLRWAGVGLAACLALAMGWWWFGPTTGQPVLAEVQGEGLSLLRAAKSVPALKDTPLQAGDVLRAPQGVTAIITFAPENTRMTITERTEVKVTSLSRGKRFYLLSGKLEASVARQRPFQPMRLMTPMAEAQVLGTKLTLYTTAKRTRLEVTEGAVRITKLGSEDSTKVSGGHYAVVAANTELKPLPLTGSIFREYWTNISGTAWTELTTNDRYPAHPDGRESVTNFTVFEMPANRSRNYGERFRGYIQPPETGQYTFWIAGRSEASLFLSPDENPDHRVHMAYSETRTQRDWEAKPAQTSGAIRLTAGKKYYFEVVHKAGTTGDFLAIAWKGPGHDRELVPFEVLSPYKPTGKERKP